MTRVTGAAVLGRDDCSGQVCVERGRDEMNLYAMLSSGVGINDATSLYSRLTAWHDAMVAHERRQRTDSSEVCDDECPHSDAQALWTEAEAEFGSRAHQLTFLRTRALGTAGRSGYRAATEHDGLAGPAGPRERRGSRRSVAPSTTARHGDAEHREAGAP